VVAGGTGVVAGGTVVVAVGVACVACFDVDAADLVGTAVDFDGVYAKGYCDAGSGC
jgi:hypothetical protein